MLACDCQDTLQEQKQRILDLQNELSRLSSIEAEMEAMSQQSQVDVRRELDLRSQEVRERYEAAKSASAVELAVVSQALGAMS